MVVPRIRLLASFYPNACNVESWRLGWIAWHILPALAPSI